MSSALFQLSKDTENDARLFSSALQTIEDNDLAIVEPLLAESIVEREKKRKQRELESKEKEEGENGEGDGDEGEEGKKQKKKRRKVDRKKKKE